jgi:ubiquinone/menaquinone biosynthesis C-methylase UbiE
MTESSAACTFGETAETYERVRPEWPAVAVDQPVRELGLEPTSIALDLGAGSGKLTRLLVGRFARVVAVEPLHAMRGLLERLVPNAESLAGAAEAIPLDDNCVDAVFCADAFHWFDGQRALAEIERVLRPGGGLVLMWNEPEKPTEPSIAAAGALLNERGSVERQVNLYASGAWRQPFSDSRFDEMREARFSYEQVVDREQLLSYFASMSWIAVLPQRERDQLLGEVNSLLDADSYTRFWQAEVYYTALRA